MVVFPCFFPHKRRNLCFAINVLNNKTIILLNFAEHRLILANSSAKYQAIFRAILQDNGCVQSVNLGAS